MSCCKGPLFGEVLSTLVKVRLTDGRVMWAVGRDTGVSSFSVAVDGSSIYEAGPRGTSNGHLTKWTDNGTTATREWDFESQAVAGTDGEHVINSASDSVVWLSVSGGFSGTNKLHRINSSTGVEINSSNEPTGNPNRVLFDGPGTGAYQYDSSLNDFYEIDSSFTHGTKLTSVSQYPFRLGTAVDSDFIAFDNGDPGQRVKRYDSDLTELDTGDYGSGHGPVWWPSHDGEKFVVSNASAQTIKLVNADTMAVDWTKSSFLHNSGNNGVIAIDSSYNVYAKNSTTLYKLAAADGSTEWSVTDGISTFAELYTDDSRNQLLTWTLGKSPLVEARLYSDGSKLWEWRTPASGGFSKATVRSYAVSGQFAYVAGGGNVYTG